MTTYRSAIIGTGSIAGAHARALQEHPRRVKLIAACDIDQDRIDAFCDEWEVPAGYTDVDRLLAQEQPDLVHICTPPGLHAQLSIKAMKAGAWVLCEKPICASLAELDQVQAVEDETGSFCSSVFQLRFGSGGQHLKKLMAGGALGRPLVGQCITTWYRGHDYYAVPWRGKWETELGGPTMGHGIHNMDLFLWLMGDWEEVRAQTATLDREIEVEDVSAATVRFASGAVAAVLNTCLSPRQETYMRLDFQKATVEVRHLYSYKNEDWQFTGAPDVDEEEVESWRQIPADVPASHASQIGALLDSMDQGTRPLISGLEARRVLAFITALYKAAATGEPVTPHSLITGDDDPFYHAVHGGRSVPRFGG